MLVSRFDLEGVVAIAAVRVGFIGNGFWDHYVDAANLIHNFNKGVKIDGRVIIDFYAEKGLDCIDGQGKTAAGVVIYFTIIIGLIDAVDADAGDFDPHVSRQRQNAG